MTITENGTLIVPLTVGRQATFAASGSFDSASLAIGYPITQPVAASLDVDDDTETPAFTVFAINGGTQGNAYAVGLAAALPSQPLSVAKDGPIFDFHLATDAGDAATVTTAMTGADNDITITADVAGTVGNAYSVELLAGSGTTQALAVSTVDNLKFSVLLGRAANAISSTAAQVVAALNAYAPFAALMTAAVKSGDAGTGVVTALTETSLAGGGDNFAITTTSAELVEFINTNPILAPHIIAELAEDYDGAGLCVVTVETLLSGGSFGLFETVETITAAGVKTVRNTGVSPYMAIVVSGVPDETPATDITMIVNKLPKP
jgi:hypothetical protein